jgi:hypothetical protein
MSDDQLAALVIDLRADNRLCQVHEQLEGTGAADYLLAGSV